MAPIRPAFDSPICTQGKSVSLWLAHARSVWNAYVTNDEIQPVLAPLYIFVRTLGPYLGIRRDRDIVAVGQRQLQRLQLPEHAWQDAQEAIARIDCCLRHVLISPVRTVFEQDERTPSVNNSGSRSQRFASIAEPHVDGPVVIGVLVRCERREHKLTAKVCRVVPAKRNFASRWLLWMR